MTTISVWSLRAPGQRRSLGLARGLLRRAVAEELGHEAVFEHRPGHAPLVDGLAVSLSRTENVAMCAVGACPALGIDVEQLRPLDEVRDMVPLMTKAKPTDAREVLALWTRKEAFAKATGMGLPDDVRDLEVPEASLEVGTWIRADGWLWVGCPCEDGCVASLVVKSPGPDGQGGFDCLEPRVRERGVRVWSLLLPI